MSTDKMLSQAEIEALMSSLAAEQDPATPVQHEPAQPAKSVKLYDFRRPDKFSKDHMRALRILFGSFARMLASSLTSYLRTSIQIRLTLVEQATYDEYIRSLPSPTVVYVVNLSPLPGQAVIELNLGVARDILDRLLGGNGMLTAKPREMTDIELTLLKTVGTFVANSLRDAWSNVLPLQPTLQEPGLSPEFVQVTLPAETTVMLVLEISLPKTTGTLSICLPHPVLQPVMEKITAQVWSSTAPMIDTEDTRLNPHEELGQVSLALTSELGRTDITVRDLLSLAEGQVIKLDTSATGDLPVLVGNHTKFRGRPGVVGKNLAVQITGVQMG